MALSRSLKRPIQMLLSSRICSSSTGQNYSTWTSRAPRSSTSTFVTQFTEPKPLSESIFGTFSRRFSASSADQINLIKQLRERTSAPITDVKAALVSCNWDIEEAHTELRKRGKVVAAKKSGRPATEGFIAVAEKDGKAILLELNCETDFVAKNELFQHLAVTLAQEAVLNKTTTYWSPGIRPVVLERIEELRIYLDHPNFSGETIAQDAITEVAAMMGENVRLRRAFVMTAPSPGVLSTYLHASPQEGLGRIAGIVAIDTDNPEKPLDELKKFGSELGMHVVATRPLFLTREQVSPSAIETELEVIKSQASSAGKSQLVIDKMVEGRLWKYYKEVVLMEQSYVKGESMTIKELLIVLSNLVGATVRIQNFFRMELGEGLQRSDASSGNEPVAQAA